MWKKIKQIKQQIGAMLDNHAENAKNIISIFFFFDLDVMKFMSLAFILIYLLDNKRQLFYLQTVLVVLTILITLPILYNYYNVTKILETIRLRLNSYTEYYCRFFTTIIKYRYLIYTVATFSLIMTIKTIDCNTVFTLTFKGLHEKNYCVGLIISYVLLKLDQYYMIREIIFPIIRELEEQRHVSGFRFVVAGRVDRTERATYMLKKIKALPLVEKTADIDYDSDSKILRYGMIGIKFWLNLVSFFPGYYQIKYLIELPTIISPMYALRNLYLNNY